MYFQISIFSQLPNIKVLTLRLVYVTLFSLSLPHTYSCVTGNTEINLLHLHWIIRDVKCILTVMFFCLLVVSTTSRLSLLWLAVCLCVSSTWGGTWSPRSLSFLTCALWHVSDCSGWLKTPVVELTQASIGSLCYDACLASRSWTIRVRVQCLCHTPQLEQKHTNDCAAFMCTMKPWSWSYTFNIFVVQ